MCPCRHKALSRVPIILLTAQNIALDGDGPLLAAFSDVHMLSMPFDLDVLERLVSRLQAAETRPGW